MVIKSPDREVFYWPCPSDQRGLGFTVKPPVLRALKATRALRATTALKVLGATRASNESLQRDGSAESLQSDESAQSNESEMYKNEPKRQLTIDPLGPVILSPFPVRMSGNHNVITDYQ